MENLDIRRYQNYEELSEAAAKMVVEQVSRKPSLSICAATGSSPTGCYERLARSDASFELATLVMLDEWGEVAPNHPVSCAYYLNQYLIEPLGFREVIGFDSQASPEQETQRMNQLLAQRDPIDLCILGIGTNGHLGFNEPSDHLEPLAHKALLSEESLTHPMICDLDQKPTYGLTLGMAQILQSRKILLLVNGNHKQDIMKTWAKQVVTPHLPASFLWLHPDVAIFSTHDVW